MKETKAHIIYKSAVIALVVTLLLPSLVKFTHIFEDHKHEVCETPQKSHFHEFDIDCEFYKFKLNPQIYVITDVQYFTDTQANFKLIISQYQFISDYQRLSFSLRGPPSLV